MNQQLVSNLLLFVATAIGGWIARHIRTPKDHERAANLDSIARGAAALVVSLNPKAAWADLIKQVVDRIASSAGLPTTNKDAIERAAAAALADLGKAPGA